MQKRIFHVFAVLVLAALMVAPAMAQPGAQGPVRITIEPAEPTVNDLVRILQWGTWSDGCAPRVVSTQVEGRNITLHVAPPTTFDSQLGCITALTPFAYSADVGTLQRGRYTLEAFLMLPGDRLEPFGEASFIVVPGPAAISLHDDRFLVRVRWTDSDGETGVGRIVPSAAKHSAVVRFGDAESAELLVQIRDNCETGGHYSVSVGGATDVGYEVRVRDMLNGTTWKHTTAPGTRAMPEVGSGQFSCF